MALWLRLCLGSATRLGTPTGFRAAGGCSPRSACMLRLPSVLPEEMSPSGRQPNSLQTSVRRLEMLAVVSTVSMLRDGCQSHVCCCLW